MKKGIFDSIAKADSGKRFPSSRPQLWRSGFWWELGHLFRAHHIGDATFPGDDGLMAKISSPVRDEVVYFLNTDDDIKPGHPGHNGAPRLKAPVIRIPTYQERWLYC